MADVTATKVEDKKEPPKPDEKPEPPKPPAPAQPPPPAPSSPAPDLKPQPKPPEPKPPEPPKPEPVPEKKPEPAPKPPEAKPAEEGLKPPEKKKPEEKKPEPAADPLASVLKNVAKMKKDLPAEKPQPKKPEEKPADKPAENPQKDVKPAPSTPSSPITAERLSISEEDALKRQIASCWNVPIGARDIENTVVEVIIVVNPDRTIREAIVVDQARMGRDQFYRAVAESALRALQNPKCIPLALPPDKYQKWKEIQFTFNPRDMF